MGPWLGVDFQAALGGVERQLVGELRANVLEVLHNRTFTSGESFGSTNAELKLETRGHEHILEIRHALGDAGFNIIDHL